MEAGVRTDLDSAIRSHPVDPDDYLVSWIVIAEWLHPDGMRSLTMSANEQMTPWARRGMLDDALNEEGWE